MLRSRLEILVEWGHCDPARIVYNPNFYDWMEHGLTGLFLAARLDPMEMLQSEPGFRGTPLVRADAAFRSPARVGDVLVLSTEVTRFGHSSFEVGHVFRIGDRLVCEASQTRIWGITRDGDRLAGGPVPQAVRDALSEDRVVTHRRTLDG